MPADNKALDFLSQYNEEVLTRALKLREVLLKNLPGITEQLDFSAKIVAYCYGQKYADMICVIIPSKNGLKLGFSRGVDLPDPDKLLEGTGKISRYIIIKSEAQITSKPLVTLIKNALAVYHKQMKKA